MVDRVIPAVSKHIATEDTLACGDIGVGADKAAYRRVIILALQVIKACFLGGRLARTLFLPLVGIAKAIPTNGYLFQVSLIAIHNMTVGYSSNSCTN